MRVLSFSFHWISSQIPHQNQPVEDLIRTIDWALYATKAQGGDLEEVGEAAPPASRCPFGREWGLK